MRPPGNKDQNLNLDTQDSQVRKTTGKGRLSQSLADPPAPRVQVTYCRNRDPLLLPYQLGSNTLILTHTHTQSYCCILKSNILPVTVYHGISILSSVQLFLQPLLSLSCSCDGPATNHSSGANNYSNTITHNKRPSGLALLQAWR